MPIPQPGIFALGTRSQYHLEFDVRAGVPDPEVIRALARVSEPMVTAGGANVVVGLGAALWRRLAPHDAPDELAPFEPIVGIDGTGAPATQHDLWVWVHGTGEDVVWDVARAVAARLVAVADLRLEQPCFVYRDSRDLTGFVDGTANPHLEETAGVALVPDGEPGAGGSFVITQRWVHRLDAFAALAVADQERVFGRTKADSRELEGADKPADAHISRVEIHDEAGEERPIFRRSTPYGRVGESGIYFLAFSADPDRYTTMLRAMFGVDAEGVRDRLTDFSSPVTGSFYFAPALTSLAALSADVDGRVDG